MSDAGNRLSADQQEEVLEQLRQSRIVSSLPEFLVKRIISLAEMAQFSEGTEIVKEGEEISSVYFLIRGAVGFYVDGKHIIGLRRAGDIFGEMSAISHRPYPATVKAEADCVLIVLGAPAPKNPPMDEATSDFEDAEGDTVEDMLFRFFTALLTDKLNLIIQKSKE